jgi:hypothetical protein
LATINSHVIPSAATDLLFTRPNPSSFAKGTVKVARLSSRHRFSLAGKQGFTSGFSR